VASLEGSVDEAIVNLWLYFTHSVEGVADSIIPLKSNNWKECRLQRYSTQTLNNSAAIGPFKKY